MPVDDPKPFATETYEHRSKEILPPLKTIKKASQEYKRQANQVYKASLLAQGGRTTGPLASALKRNRIAIDHANPSGSQ